MQNNDTHIQKLINKAKREEPVVPKEFARTLLEKQALQASAMSHINKGTKMLNTISIASLAASVALLMNTISTSHISKNEVSKIKEQNPKEQIIVQKNDVAQAKTVKSDERKIELYSIASSENIDTCETTIFRIQPNNSTAPINQVQNQDKTNIASDHTNTSKDQVTQNNNNPIDIVGINPIKLTKEEIEKLGFVVEKGGHLSYYCSSESDTTQLIKNSILYPWGFGETYIKKSDVSINPDIPLNPLFRVISNQNGQERISIFTETISDEKDNELLSVSNNLQDKKVLLQNSLLDNYLHKIEINSAIDNKNNTTISVRLDSSKLKFDEGFNVVITDSINQNSKQKIFTTYIQSLSTTQVSNLEKLFKTIELNNLPKLIESNTVSDNACPTQFDNPINLNELLPIEVEMIDDNGEPLYTNGKLQTLIIWFEPTLEFIEKLPEQIKRKLSPELQAIPNDYETCPAPPVTGGQPHFDVWRACSGAIENLKTYPTPVEDVLHFKYNLSEGRQISMYVCNLNGEVISNPIRFSNYSKGCVEDQINVGYLNSGMYLLVISTDTGEQAVQRFLVR